MVNLVAFWRFLHPEAYSGQVFVLIVMTVMALEMAVGFGIGTARFRYKGSVEMEEARDLQRMTFVALTILGPLTAMVTILLIRRAVPMLALLGTGASLVGATVLLTNVAGGTRYSTTLPGLPEYPLRLTATPLTAVLVVVVAAVERFRDALRRRVHGRRERQSPLLCSNVLLRRCYGDAGACR